MKLSTASAFKTMQNNNKKLKKLSDKELKQLQETILEIVDDIDFVCKKYHIKYNLGGGSALGAIRHQGFIPWDDDFDINMPRADYQKFCSCFMNEFKEKYWMHTPEDTKDYGLAFARIRKKGTIYRAREDFDNQEAGVYVDIFIIENTYNFFLFRSFHGFLSLLFGFLLSCRNFYKNRKLYLDMVSENKKLRIVFQLKVMIGFCFAWISVDKMTRLWNRINSMCKNSSSNYVTVPVGRKHFFGELYEREKFCQTIDQPFGKHRTLPVCVDYDGYLTNLYGDYMKLPKKEDIEAHIFLELKL